MGNLSKTFGKLAVPLLVLLTVCFSASPPQAKYGGGTGGPNDPYLIYDANQMNAIGADSNDWDKHFKLMADIDLAGFTGTSFNIIGCWPYGDPKPFTGVFDGNNHTISNFTYTSTGTNHIGIFGYLEGGDAEIKDLGLVDPNIDAGTGYYVGSLVGWLDDGTITNCHAEGGSVSGDSGVGGLVGVNYETITNCHATARVEGADNVGGLVGNGGTITNCYSTGSVSGTTDVGGLVADNGGTITNCYAGADVSGNTRVGGLVGYNDGTITDCYSTGSVRADNRRVGGLVAHNWMGTITNCYSTASVSGESQVGGLVGLNEQGTIYNCYSTGSVEGDEYVGGLVGYNYYGTVTASFWDTQTSGQTTSAGGTGKTTAEMQMASTFIGWGACGNEGIWTLDEGNDYPHLWWEEKPGELLPAYQLSDFITGTGTETDPYLIYTAEQLNTIGLVVCDWDKYFKLMADIDLSSFTGTSFNIIGINPYISFSGVFDGNGHTISNFTYTSTGANHIGLFGCVSLSGEVKDLGLIDPNINNAGTGETVGSLVGQIQNGTIINCYVEGGSVSGTTNVGGLVGYNWYGTITNCYSTGSVAGGSVVGGLVGFNDGWLGGSITNCYSTGSVSGARYVGGLVGYNNGAITNCYSTDSVTGSHDVGGLVGRQEDGDIKGSFWDIETSGQSTSAGGTGKTTAEMQTASTFTDAGWDFVGETINGPNDIWDICEGTNYPRLLWQIPAGDFLCPDGVDMRDFAVLAAQWMQPPSVPSADIAPNGGDNIVDRFDLAEMADNWLRGF